MKSRVLKSVAVVGIATALSACSNSRALRGYVFDPEISNQILQGVDNRDSVQASLGNPSLPSMFDQDTWYYVATQVRQRPVFWPDPKWHRVMAIKFAENGTVSSVTNYDISDRRRIFPVQEKTPTLGRDDNFFLQLFANVGQFGGVGGGQPGQRRGPGRPNG